MKYPLLATSLVALALQSQLAAPAYATDLVMGSWRTEDIDAWNRILGAFHTKHPEINIRFEPTVNTEYMPALQTQLQAKKGPDIISCAPFDFALKLYNMGGLADISDLRGYENFPETALAGWRTDDGKHTYCVPVGSVIQGFYYNKNIFQKIGLAAPKTESEFFAALDKLKKNGVTPLDMGTKDLWPSVDLAFNSVWPNYCDGENTRKALIAGTAKLTDECFMKAFNVVARWGAYLPDGSQSIGYADTQQIFPLGNAAIFPGGSWEIPLLGKIADFDIGVFPPFEPDGKTPGKCWFVDHVDMGIGMNANTSHPPEVRAFLEWLTTPEFSQLFIDNQPGFFPLSKYKVSSKNPLAAEFASWREKCGSVIRLPSQFLSRGTPGLEQTLEDSVYLLIRGQETPQQTADKAQASIQH
jgi:raffinose/stachyose/melibiose transport system substrate-binding protein